MAGVHYTKFMEVIEFEKGLVEKAEEDELGLDSIEEDTEEMD